MEKEKRLPPGQIETKRFPVLSLGDVPEIDKKNWSLEIFGLVDKPIKWNWKEFNNLPSISINKDIHCVTRWSKFDTRWKGVSVDEIIKKVKVKKNAKFVIVQSYDGYSTNIPLEEVKNNEAIVAFEYEGKEIEAEHGGPARLLVPNLYFWKSAKWIKSIEFSSEDRPGYWEVRGYHNHGDPRKEERFG